MWNRARRCRSEEVSRDGLYREAFANKIEQSQLRFVKLRRGPHWRPWSTYARLRLRWESLVTTVGAPQYLLLLR